MSDPTPRADVHELVAKVLDLYRAAIRDGDGPEDLAARYVAATLRGAEGALRDIDNGTCGCGCRCATWLGQQADEIDPSGATP